MDDLTGESLDTEEVRKARRLDIVYLERVGGCDRGLLPTSKGGGRRVLSARWVDAEKDDAKHMSRLVSKHIKTHGATEFFVETPCKYDLRRAAQYRNKQVLHIAVMSVCVCVCLVAAKKPDRRRASLVWQAGEGHVFVLFTSIWRCVCTSWYGLLPQARLCSSAPETTQKRLDGIFPQHPATWRRTQRSLNS